MGEGRGGRGESVSVFPHTPPRGPFFTALCAALFASGQSFSTFHSLHYCTARTSILPLSARQNLRLLGQALPSPVCHYCRSGTRNGRCGSFQGEDLVPGEDHTTLQQLRFTRSAWPAARPRNSFNALSAFVETPPLCSRLCRHDTAAAACHSSSENAIVTPSLTRRGEEAHTASVAKTRRRARRRAGKPFGRQIGVRLLCEHGEDSRRTRHSLGASPCLDARSSEQHQQSRPQEKSRREVVAADNAEWDGRWPVSFLPALPDLGGGVSRRRRYVSPPLQVARHAKQLHFLAEARRR